MASTSGWPAPYGATEVLPATVQVVDHDRWLAERRRGLGGSDIAAVLGLHPMQSAYEVWLSKTGRLPPKDSTYLMERGHRFEAACAQWFSDETGLSTRKTGTWVRDDAPWMLANPDRFTSDGAGYEGKIVGEDWGRWWKYGPAQHAAYQAVWCMAVTGLDRWYIAAAMDHRFEWWCIDRPDDLIEQTIDFCGGWWYDHIVNDTPPTVDDSDATTEALKAAYAQPQPEWRRYESPEPLSHMAEIPGLTALRDERRRLKKDEAATRKALAKVENEIKAALGNARVGLENGLPVMGWPIRSRTAVDQARAKEEYPDLLVATEFRQLEDFK